MRPAAVACAVLLGAMATATPSAVGVGVTITGMRVITADTRVPVRPPFHLARAYAYVVRYRITGPGLITVRRRAVLRTAGGTLIARVAPPESPEESGAYFASARIPLGPRDPQATYVLAYVIQVRGRGGATGRATRVLRLPFRP